MELHKAAVFLAGCALALAASAQWQWLDNSGSKVFSDRAPPPDIPAKNILKQPGGAKNKLVAMAEDAAPVASAPKINSTDKTLEDKKKQAEEAAAAKRKAEADKLDLARAENCTRARQSKATFDSGVRVARSNDKGEREIMDDAARAAESKRMADIIATDCK